MEEEEQGEDSLGLPGGEDDDEEGSDNVSTACA